MIYTSTGFPSRVTDHIELPDIAEILLNPMLSNVPVENVLKHGTEFNKYLVNKTNFTNKKKYIYISQKVSFLTPDISPVININKSDKEWHVDGDDTFDQDGVVYHILQNKTSSLTDFNNTEFTLDVENTIQLIKMLNNDKQINGLLQARQAEPNKIYTFDNNNIHRASRTSKPELRFFYRVVETDIKMENESEIGTSVSNNKSTTSFVNIIQEFQNNSVKNINMFTKKR